MFCNISMNYWQAFEKIKLTQVARYHKAKTQAEKDQIVCDPIKIFHMAVANVKPVFKFTRYIKGGTIYMVSGSRNKTTSMLAALIRLFTPVMRSIAVQLVPYKSYVKTFRFLLKTICLLFWKLSSVWFTVVILAMSNLKTVLAYW